MRAVTDIRFSHIDSTKQLLLSVVQKIDISENSIYPTRVSTNLLS